VYRFRRECQRSQGAFLAIARGLLKYLHDHQLDMVSKMDLNIGATTAVTNNVSNLQLNVTV
jgi:hypothetical protein